MYNSTQSLKRRHFVKSVSEKNHDYAAAVLTCVNQDAITVVNRRKLFTTKMGGRLISELSHGDPPPSLEIPFPEDLSDNNKAPPSRGRLVNGENKCGMQNVNTPSLLVMI